MKADAQMSQVENAFNYDYGNNSAVKTNTINGTRLEETAKQGPAMKNDIPMKSLELFQTEPIEAKFTNTEQLTTKADLIDMLVPMDYANNAKLSDTIKNNT